MNFEKKSPKEINSFGVRFDYGSLMHYSKTTFSKTSLDYTILPKYDPAVHIGQREKLSELDIQQANLRYQCPG